MGLAVSPLKTRKWKVTSCTYLCPFLKLSQKGAPGINHLSPFVYQALVLPTLSVPILSLFSVVIIAPEDQPPVLPGKMSALRHLT